MSEQQEEKSTPSKQDSVDKLLNKLPLPVRGALGLAILVGLYFAFVSTGDAGKAAEACVLHQKLPLGRDSGQFYFSIRRPELIDSKVKFYYTWTLDGDMFRDDIYECEVTKSNNGFSVTKAEIITSVSHQK